MNRDDNRNRVFDANRAGLALITEIISALRAQYIYTSAVKIKELIVHLQAMMEELGEGIWETVSVDELFPILDAIVLAQQRNDWIFLADILEGDLRSFLQRFQMEVMERSEIVRPDYFSKNMEILRCKNEKLYRVLCGNKQAYPLEYTLIPAVNGELTMYYHKEGVGEIYLHSMIDPAAAAKEFIREWYLPEKKEYCILGFGLGYHVFELLGMSKAVSVIVLERDIEAIVLAMQFFDWSEFLETERLQIKYESKVNMLLKAVTENSMLLVHYPFLQCMKSGEEKEALENYFISANSIREQKRDMDNNFFLLQNMGLEEGSSIISKIRDKILVIVAAGPSLERELGVLREVQRNEDILILSVGTVAEKLIENEIYPSFILITDAWEDMYKQVENIKEKNIPLLLLSTASARAAKEYVGPCCVLYQEGYEPAEKVAKENNYTLFSTGGSVATLAIDIGLRMKARRIIMCGVDLAYSDCKLHAFEEAGEMPLDAVGARETDGVGGRKVKTGRNLDIYRKWIEKRILNQSDVKIYNASYGARIEGTKEMGLLEAISD